MYATINLPGSSHFEYFGPASKADCENWLKERVARLSETELITSLLPQRIVSNKDAEAWKYLDGTHVCRPQVSDKELEQTFGPKSLPCGCPRTEHRPTCPGYGL